MNTLEAYELAIHLCGIDNEHVDEDQIEDEIYDKYGMDFEQFRKLAGDLLPLCVIGTAALSGKTYQGFGVNGCFIAKRELTEAA